MKTSSELKQKRHALMGELRNLSSSDLEQREIDKKESDLYDKIHKLSGDIINAEIEEKRRAEEILRTGTVISTSDAKDISKYSLTRAMRVALDIEKGGIEEEMNQEAKREIQNIGHSLKGFGIPSIVLNRASSGQNYGSAADGGYLVGQGGMMFFQALRNKLSLAKLGARFLTGLHGTLPLVGGGTFTASFATEGTEISTSKIAFASRGTLIPKRLQATGAISKELIHQSSPDVEQIIVNELTSSIAQAIEDAAINGSGSGANPSGILNTVGIGAVVGGTNGAAPTWADIVNLEREVAVDNADTGALGFLTNPKVRAKLKQTAVGTDQRMIWAPNEEKLMGYNTAVTNQVPSDLDKGTSTGVCSAIIFGAWNELIIGQWGGLDLILDPYSRKGFGEIEISTSQFVDLGLSHPESFAAMKDALTT